MSELSLAGHATAEAMARTTGITVVVVAIVDDDDDVVVLVLMTDLGHLITRLKQHLGFFKAPTANTIRVYPSGGFTGQDIGRE